MLKKLVLSSALIALLMSLTTLGFAQGSAESSVTGSISAYVTDPSGATISDAKVTLTGATGEKVINTGGDGKVLFQVLPPGAYSLKVEKTGFKTADVKGVEVVIGRASIVTAKMEVGAASTTVEVTADAIAVDTTSTANGANLNDQFYQSVPVGRGVTGLFYAAAGVASGGGTGTANPSISGGTGLENNYVADGVSITDGGFGGIGVYSRLYGSLSTGINLSFVKEVQVKTGGFEAQYGKSTGGIVQIVTKSGGTGLHGVIGGFFAPDSFEATRKFTDDFANGSPDQRFNLQGKILHQTNYDADVEVGGQVPGLGKRLFFFGSFNPSWNTDHDQYAQFRNPSDCGISPGVPACVTGTPTQTSLGNVDISNRVLSYAGKLTFKINDNHQLESSVFGDPTYGHNDPNGPALVVASPTVNDKLQYGTRNFVVRYNGALTPSWLLNGSFTWGHNNLSDTPAVPDLHFISDLVQRLPCGAPSFNALCTSPDNPARGQYSRQGLGYFENTTGDNYGLNVDTSKSFRFLGEHNVTVGWSYARSHYDGVKERTGPRILIDPLTAAGITSDPGFQNALETFGTNGTFQMRSNSGLCGTSEIY